MKKNSGKLTHDEKTEISVSNFELTACEELFAKFTLHFRGLTIPGCGAFFTRKGSMSWQLPYIAHFEIGIVDMGIVKMKLHRCAHELEA
jgi:hypothetical protein